MAFTIHPTYRWRGKIHTTISGLVRACYADYPGCDISFVAGALALRPRSGQRLFFALEPDSDGNSVIADQPLTEEAALVL